MMHLSRSRLSLRYQPRSAQLSGALPAVVWLLLATAGLGACRKAELPEPAPATESTKPAALEKAEPPPPAAPAVPAPDAATSASSDEVGPDGLRPGWTKVLRRDSAPVCVFASALEREKNQVLAKVKKQTLKANTKLTFGVFPPWCLNEACDENAYLQCWVDREDDNTLVMNTRFASYRKDGADCTDGCMEIDAACETPELPPGKYTVRHGDKTYKLRIPGVLLDPCFGRP
jgi:hypothetical protein